MDDLEIGHYKTQLRAKLGSRSVVENVKVGMSMNWTEANLKHYKPNLELATSSRASQIPTSQ